MAAPLSLLEELARAAESNVTKDQLIVLFEREVAEDVEKIMDFRRLSTELRIQTSQPLIQIKMGIRFRLFYQIFRFRCANQIQIYSLLINKQHLTIRRRDGYVAELRASRSCDDTLGTIEMLSGMLLDDMEKASRLLLMARET
ncbi:hypothetical protein Tco_0878891 [Tanacetum coccineum]|uniref:Uncharacterized protein n=1 Tax=Tanacetum coccineum TaxID=301880 RepID=A0ABQ5BZ42_9ASTR